jgi:hypothetical protein
VIFFSHHKLHHFYRVSSSAPDVASTASSFVYKLSRGILNSYLIVHDTDSYQPGMPEAAAQNEPKKLPFILIDSMTIPLSHT